MSRQGVQTFSKKEDGNNRITENFKILEFACRDGSDKILVDVDAVKKLQSVRDLFGRSIKINSAYRPAAYNKLVGGSSKSYHIKGRAFDTVMAGVSESLLAKAYEVAGMKGIIIYQTFVHADSRTWSYFTYHKGKRLRTNLMKLKQGSSGQDVSDLQWALNEFAGQRLTVDGTFGSKTKAIIQQYQKENNLTPDGIVGKKTWRKLLGGK